MDSQESAAIAVALGEGATTLPHSGETESAIRIILRTPLYRGATIGLFIAGLGGAAATPQIAAFLVNELDASLRTAGLFYLTSLTAPIAGYLVGARSDRTGQRLGFFRICAAAGFLGWLACAFATQLWMPFLLSATILAFAGASMSQLFAAIHDDIAANPTPAGDSVFATVRMAVTAGWIIGPVIGTTIAGAYGTRTVIIMTAICALAQIVPLGMITLSASIPRATRTGQAPISARASLQSMTPLLVFTALSLSFSASEAVKHAFLPLYMADHLHLSSTMQGLAIGIQPFVEFPLIPVAIVGARRFGALRLITVATGIAMFANLWFAMADSAVDILIAQSLMGVVWGVFAALGILVAQRLLRTAVATASGIFMTSGAIGSAIGGFAGGLGVGTLGLPGVFVLPAVFCLIAAIGLTVLHTRMNHLVG